MIFEPLAETEDAVGFVVFVRENEFGLRVPLKDCIQWYPRDEVEIITDRQLNLICNLMRFMSEMLL